MTDSLKAVIDDLVFDLDAIGFADPEASVSGAEAVNVLCMYIDDLRSGLKAEDRLRDAAQYAFDNLLAAQREGLITAPKWFQVQLDESRRLLEGALK